VPIRCLGFLAALVAAVLAPGLARASETGHTLAQVVDGYSVTFALAPERGETGPNDVIVSIRTPDGSPVADAVVTVAVHSYAADGHSASHDETPAANHQVAPGADADHAATADHSASPADGHGDDHAAAGHVHAGIPTMLETGPAPGSYSGVLHLEQAGTATVTVAFAVGGQAHEALFDVPVVQARPRTLVLAGFAAVNGGAILVAAALKRRMRQKQRGTAASAPPSVIAFNRSPTAAEEERPT
jgi:hypothetical protein